MDNIFSQSIQNHFKSGHSNLKYNAIPDAPSQVSSQFFTQPSTQQQFIGYTQNIEVSDEIFPLPSSSAAQTINSYVNQSDTYEEQGQVYVSQPYAAFTSQQYQQQLKQINKKKKKNQNVDDAVDLQKRATIENDSPMSSQYSKFFQYGMKTPNLERMRKNDLDITQPFIQLETPRNVAIPVVNEDGSTSELKSIAEKYRPIFPFPYFNALQSKVFDEVMYSDNPVVVCSPTGSGKTVLFELCIIRLLLRSQNKKLRYKIVYMAPIKALCSERYQDWTTKFSPFGLKCTELTGDTDLDDFHELQYSHIVFTTPEKWDSMTRKWKDNKSLVQSVRLFFIDEVHLLNDNTRGATMEAVVSRMKTVQVSIKNELNNSDAPVMRFVAVSATIPNVNDIASWLDTGLLPAVAFSLGENYRPVALRKIVLGYPYTEKQSDFKFDLALNYKLSNIIQTYSENKPSLVFCCTRKSVTQAAGVLVKDARFIMNYQHKQRLTQHANSFHDSKLQELVLHGVGFHHAGLDQGDRKHIEDMFSRGDLPVLFCTSTLAMGVNLPAHLVIVKGTMHYVMGGYEEYSEAQVLQMMGRAGRPQFDTSATAVVMTKQRNKAKYQAMITGTHKIESSLHHHLTEHINAEVVLGTITDVNVAQEWLKSTFLYKRMQENPKHYGAPDGLDKKALGQKLQDMCLGSLKSLQSYELVELHDNQMLVPTEIGKLMARYCIAFDSVKIFSSSSGHDSLEELAALLSKAKEFADITIRQNERKILNILNKDKNRITIRFPMNSKIKTTELKINCLLQSALGCLAVNEFSLTQDISKILRIGQRVTKFMMEFFVQRQSGFQSALNAILLCKCVKARLWENSKFVSRQLERIGPSLSSALVNAGITTFEKIENTNPRELEMIMNRHPPFGSQVKEVVAALPKLDVVVEQDRSYQSSIAELILIVKLFNYEVRSKCLKTKKMYQQGYFLIIGDSENHIVFKQRILDSYLLHNGRWSRKITVQRACKSSELSINLICLDYVGLDVQSSFKPVYTGPAPRAVMITKPNSTSNYSKPLEGTLRTSCSHKCINKLWCGHQCCKTGLPSSSSYTPKIKEKVAKDKSFDYSMRQDETPPAHKGSPMIRFYDEVQRRKNDLPNIQPLKKIKVELTLNQNYVPAKKNLLQSYEYVPKKLNFGDKASAYSNNNNGGLLSQVSNFQAIRKGHNTNNNAWRESDSLFCLGDTSYQDDDDKIYDFDDDFYKSVDHPLPLLTMADEENSQSAYKAVTSQKRLVDSLNSMRNDQCTSSRAYRSSYHDVGFDTVGKNAFIRPNRSFRIDNSKVTILKQNRDSSSYHNKRSNTSNVRPEVSHVKSGVMHAKPNVGPGITNVRRGITNVRPGIAGVMSGGYNVLDETFDDDIEYQDEEHTERCVPERKRRYSCKNSQQKLLEFASKGNNFLFGDSIIDLSDDEEELPVAPVYGKNNDGVSLFNNEAMERRQMLFSANSPAVISKGVAIQDQSYVLNKTATEQKDLSRSTLDFHSNYQQINSNNQASPLQSSLSESEKRTVLKTAFMTKYSRDKDVDVNPYSFQKAPVESCSLKQIVNVDVPAMEITDTYHELPSCINSCLTTSAAKPDEKWQSNVFSNKVDSDENYEFWNMENLKKDDPWKMNEEQASFDFFDC